MINIRRRSGIGRLQRVRDCTHEVRPSCLRAESFSNLRHLIRVTTFTSTRLYATYLVAVTSVINIDRSPWRKRDQGIYYTIHRASEIWLHAGEISTARWIVFVI